MSTEYTACCDRLSEDCFCDEEVTVVERDEPTEARLRARYEGFSRFLDAISRSMKPMNPKPAVVK